MGSGNFDTGVPIYYLALTMDFACLSFLQSTKKTASALGLLVNLVSNYTNHMLSTMGVLCMLTIVVR